MGRIGITYSEVAKAITTLQSLQKNPTVDNIREIMGTGSKSTIARFLREWKAKHGLHSDDDGRLPSDLLGIVTGLWQAIQEKADTQADIEIQVAQTQTLEMKQSLISQQQLQSTVQTKIHQLEENNAQYLNEIETLKQALLSEEKEKLKLTERNTLFESKFIENKAEIDRLHDLLKHVQENLEHYQLSTQNLRQEQLLQMEKARSEFDQQIMQKQTMINELSSQNSALEMKREFFQNQHESIDYEHRMLVLRHTNTQEEHGKLEIGLDQMEKDYSTLLKKYEQQTGILENKSMIAMELDIKLKLNIEKITSLENDLSSANNKIHTLRHEQQFTLQEKANLEGQLKQMQSMISVKRAASVPV